MALHGKLGQREGYLERQGDFCSTKLVLLSGETLQLKERFGPEKASYFIYELFAEDGKMLQSWEAAVWRGGFVIPLSGDFAGLTLRKTLWGSWWVRAGKEKTPLRFELHGATRIFKFRNITVKHRDFQSECTISCPKESLATAVLMAQIVFSGEPRVRND